jgi:hypothetical protein
MKRVIMLALCFVSALVYGQDTRRQKVKVKTLHLKRIVKKNYLYIYSDGGLNGGESNLYIVRPQQNFWATIREENSYITVKQDPKVRKINPVKWDTLFYAKIPNPSGNQTTMAETYFFPETFFSKIECGSFKRYNTTHDSSGFNSSVCDFKKSLRYHDRKIVFQTLTIPLKFRKAIDTFPYQTESGVNLGFGVGYKAAMNWYKQDKGVLGQRTNQLSFTPGVFFGAGVVDIKAKSNAPATFKDRKDPFISYGGFFMIGINNINLGVALGRDVALKDGGKSGGWAFNNQTWKGLIVALDVLK